jgi:probable HAF family extracellular repeat protein
MWMIRKTALVAVAVAALAASSARGDYVFTNFDGPGNNAGGTTANGINNLGQIVGFSSNTGGTTLTNFIRNTDGSFTTLDTVNESSAAMANGINSTGSVVGASGSNAFLFQGTTLSDLGAPNPGNTTSEAAFGINDTGQAVGQYVDSSTSNEPGFLMSGSTFTILSPSAQALVTNAQGINNNGLVVGFFSETGTPTVQHGFLYNSINKTYSTINDPTPALAEGQSIVLTQFLGISDKDLAVGYYQTSNGSQHGFIYNADTQQYTFVDDPDAAATGVSTTQITGINNSGEIAGFFVDSDGAQHGFLAIPSSTPTPVPLPAAAWSGLALLAGLGTMNIARRKLAQK